MTATCPACSEIFQLDACESVNADRRPDLRDAVVDGSFQVIGCPKCDAHFRLDPLFNYLDMGRGQWISVQPLSSMPDWIENEDEALVTFSKAYGAEAPPAAKEIGDDLRPRLVFGWAALREKLVAADCQLDDVALELLKLAIVDGLDNVPLAAGNELRFEGLVDDELELNWVNAQTEAVVESLRVPRVLYDDIVKDAEAWGEVRKMLEAGPFVDMQKLYMGQGRPTAV